MSMDGIDKEDLVINSYARLSEFKPRKLVVIQQQTKPQVPVDSDKGNKE